MIGKRRTGEEKDAAVDAAARAIIASEAGDRIAKTSRLKEARLKLEAADAAKPEEPAPGKTGKNVRVVTK